MKAINQFIVIEKIKAQERKVSGLLLTEEIDDEVRYQKARVVSKGVLCVEIEEGDVICYDKHAGHGIEWGDNLYYVIQYRDVVFVE
tara:strand:- start:1126 stop:1383 length:258 start_codon:yes stop_codon:yes gene_type:complete